MALTPHLKQLHFADYRDSYRSPALVKIQGVNLALLLCQKIAEAALAKIPAKNRRTLFFHHDKSPRPLYSLEGHAKEKAVLHGRLPAGLFSLPVLSYDFPLKTVLAGGRGDRKIGSLIF